MAIQQTTPTEAHGLLQQGHTYLDVRTATEFAAGHAAGAVNIPVALPDPATGQMALNPEFIALVQRRFRSDTRLVIGCQSGVRSQRAAELLAAAGYTHLVNMQGGFGGARDSSGRVTLTGWRDSGLPVETGSATTT